MGLRMDRLDDDVGRRCHETVDRVTASIGLDLVPPRSPLNSVQMPAKAKSGRSIEGEPDNVILLCRRVRIRRVFREAVGRHQAAVRGSSQVIVNDGPIEALQPNPWMPRPMAAFHCDGRSSLASQPTASVFMGSTDIETCSVRSQVEHSNVRTSKPRTPAEMRASAIRCLHVGRIGRSLKPFMIPNPNGIIRSP
jgi:hypothetical protein